MKNYYFFKLIKKTTLQFLDIFNDMKIAKYNSDGMVNKYVNVPIKLSSKQKFHYWIHDKKHESRLPMMAVDLTGIDSGRSERGVNKDINIPINNETQHRQLVPYNLNFDLIIGALYISEIDQILEQILPFFDPYVIVRIDLPEINNSFNIKINFNSASSEKDIEIPEDNYRILNWTLNFTALGYLMKPIEDLNLIHKIYLQFKNHDLISYTPAITGDYGTFETAYLSGYKDEDEQLFYEYEILDK